MAIIKRYVSADTEKQHNINQQALDETGFWGTAGAGCLPFALDTKKFLFGLRSRHVEEPGTWGIFGGAISEGENPKVGALREFVEETEYAGKAVKLVLLSEYKHSSGFKYFSYLLVLPTEFKPRLDHENRRSVWVSYDSWPTPLHPKVKPMLVNFKVDSILQEYRGK
jgi:8-oxo-dGTP pyrophosphatase MutT (NUDIX family)